MSDEGKWTLTIGIHRGTLMSRDTEQPKKLNSRKECEDAVRVAERQYAELGCYIWFANAVDPDGQTHRLHPGTPYT